MSIGSLLSMKPNWLMSQMFSLADNGVFRPRLTAAPGMANTEVITWANAQAKVGLRPGNIILAAPASNKAYGFLPWQPGGVTYVEVDPNAQLMLTGPLSACTVWAFQSGGTTVLVHANANAGLDWAAMTPAQKDANMTTKLNAVNAIKALYPGPIVDVGRLVYANTPGVMGAQTYEGYMGFVLGTRARLGFSLNKVKWGASKKAADWTFYFYGYNGAAAANRVLWVM